MSLSVLWWVEYLSGFCERLDYISTDNKGSRDTECACTLLNLAMLVFELNPTWRVQNIGIPELVYQSFCCQFSSASTGMFFFKVWFYPEQQVKNVPWVSTAVNSSFVLSRDLAAAVCSLFWGSTGNSFSSFSLSSTCPYLQTQNHWIIKTHWLEKTSKAIESNITPALPSPPLHYVPEHHA